MQCKNNLHCTINNQVGLDSWNWKLKFFLGISDNSGTNEKNVTETEYDGDKWRIRECWLGVQLWSGHWWRWRRTLAKVIYKAFKCALLAIEILNCCLLNQKLAKQLLSAQFLFCKRSKSRWNDHDLVHHIAYLHNHKFL